MACIVIKSTGCVFGKTLASMLDPEHGNVFVVAFFSLVKVKAFDNPAFFIVWRVAGLGDGAPRSSRLNEPNNNQNHTEAHRYHLIINYRSSGPDNLGEPVSRFSQWGDCLMCVYNYLPEAEMQNHGQSVFEAIIHRQNNFRAQPVFAVV